MEKHSHISLSTLNESKPISEGSHHPLHIQYIEQTSVTHHTLHPNFSHIFTPHTPSLLTHPHPSHTLTLHTPSHTLTLHTPSLFTHPHSSHTISRCEVSICSSTRLCSLTQVALRVSSRLSTATLKLTISPGNIVKSPTWSLSLYDKTFTLNRETICTCNSW